DEGRRRGDTGGEDLAVGQHGDRAGLVLAAEIDVGRQGGEGVSVGVVLLDKEVGEAAGVGDRAGHDRPPSGRTARALASETPGRWLITLPSPRLPKVGSGLPSALSRARMTSKSKLNGEEDRPPATTILPPGWRASPSSRSSPPSKSRVTT